MTNDPELTVLSFGGGQDSTAILYKLIYDPVFRRFYAPNRLLVVISDTNNEHPETVDHIHACAELCQQNGIDFEYLTVDRGFHRASWSNGLEGAYRSNGSIGSVAYPKTCSVQLKIKPLWRFLEAWIANTYSIPNHGRKFAVKAFAQRYGKIRVLIGLARGEEKRIGADTEKWAIESVEKVYPLIETLGWDRDDCQKFIASCSDDGYVPPPSNCVMCPFKSSQEILWTYRRYPQYWDTWVELEAAKVAKHKALGRDDATNFGVKGRKLLPTVLADALANFGHWTMDELDAYRMSHGHCNTNAF